jgi:hypothetical protein
VGCPALSFDPLDLKAAHGSYQKKNAEGYASSGLAVCARRPMTLRPHLAVGLPFWDACQKFNCGVAVKTNKRTALYNMITKIFD